MDRRDYALKHLGHIRGLVRTCDKSDISRVEIPEVVAFSGLHWLPFFGVVMEYSHTLKDARSHSYSLRIDWMGRIYSQY